MNVFLQLVFFLLAWGCLHCPAQNGFVLPTGKNHGVVHFKTVGNLPLLPVTVNGHELTFLLDTGSTDTIIFSFEEVDSLTLNNTTVVQLRGLSKEAPISAIRSEGNSVKIGNALHNNLPLYVVFDGVLNFSSRLGVPIHGIIGTEFFKDFVVRINYTTEKITYYKPESYSIGKCRKCTAIPLLFINDKPYVDAIIKEGSFHKEVRLLLDSGSGDALWLFENDENNLRIPVEAFKDYLGLGINGDIYGKRFKIDELTVFENSFERVNTAYPDVNFLRAQYLSGIDGSIGGEILKRFNWVIDYGNKVMYLKKNGNFKLPFHYNMSGITLEHGELLVIRERVVKKENYSNKNSTTSQAFISNYDSFTLKLVPSYVITEIRPDSPADKIGLLPGDEILEINNEPSYKYRLYEINDLFYSKQGRKIKLKIKRDNRVRVVRLELQDI